MKKLASLLLILGILLSLCACGAANQPAPTAAAETTAEPTEEPAAELETRIVVDGLGREIEVPAKVETIVTLGNASRMATYLGLADKMITVTSGDNNDSVVMAYGYYNHDIWADLPVCSSGGYGEINPEVIIEASPDVILCTFEEDIVANIEEQLGRKVVAAPQGTLFAEDYEHALRVFGEACGVSDRAETVIAFIQECLADLDSRTSSIADDNKPTALCAAATFRGGHGIAGVYANNAVFATVNAKDVTVGYIDAQKGVEVDKEQVLEWNPDLIVLDASNLGLVENEYAEDPAFFESLNAVKNGELYQWPNSTSNYTNVEIPLVNAYYIGSVMFPEAFADVDFETKAEEIFRFFLGHDGYLSVLNNAGMGYGSVVLGK
jgi:iron complex transport system substrate-binding protein